MIEYIQDLRLSGNVKKEKIVLITPFGVDIIENTEVKGDLK